MLKKLIFMGTPQYATVILDKLIQNNYEIVCIFTQPDKKVGRKQIITPSDVKKYYLDNELNAPIYQPRRFKDENFDDILDEMDFDAIIVAAYGQILPKSVVDKYLCINLHASLLPKYRGASPIQSCLLNDDKYTGVTVMKMEEGLDSGDILGLIYLEIEPKMDVVYLFDKLAILASEIIIDVLEDYSNILAKKQNVSEVSYCQKIKKEDGLIAFDDAKYIYQEYKAYKVWPGLHTNEALKIIDMELDLSNEDLNAINSKDESGKIVEITKLWAKIACENGNIVIKTIQPPSKKPMSIVDYLRGKRLVVGNYLS
jgi:methionyl-tRNA formyltransferase